MSLEQWDGELVITRAIKVLSFLHIQKFIVLGWPPHLSARSHHMWTEATGKGKEDKESVWGRRGLFVLANIFRQLDLCRHLKVISSSPNVSSSGVRSPCPG